MKIYLYYSFICVLLIIAGVALGGLLNSNLGTYDVLHKLLSSIASIATIFGIGLAAMSLTTWKKQSLHQKIDGILDEVENVIPELCMAYNTAWYAEDNYNLESAVESDRKNQIALLQKLSSARMPVIEVKIKYELLFDKLSFYIRSEDAGALKPECVNRIAQYVSAMLDEDKEKGFPTDPEKAINVELEIANTAYKMQTDMLNSLYSLRAKHLSSSLLE